MEGGWKIKEGGNSQVDFIGSQGRKGCPTASQRGKKGSEGAWEAKKKESKNKRAGEDTTKGGTQGRC